MKNYILISFLIFALNISFSQKKIGIYYASLRLEEPLMNDVYLANSGNSVSNRYVKSALFPQYLIDSLKTEILHFASKITKAKVEYIYLKGFTNDTVYTGSGGEIEGFPRNSKRNAIMTNFDEFLDIRFTLLSRGGEENIGIQGIETRYKPSLIVNISRIDKTGKRISKQKLNFKSFQWKGNTRKTVYVKPVLERRKNVLHPEDLYILMRKGIEMSEEKILTNE
jgi:hypothetical protein